MNNRPLRKLNKRLIYICLISSVAIAIPMMIIPIAKNKKVTDELEERPSAQAMAFVDDAFTISGTEKFPASYEQVKEFEKEKVEPKVSNLEQDFEEVFGKLGNIDQAPNKDIKKSSKKGLPEEENPWVEAQKREQKRRAFDYFDARRSDILFVDNTQQKNQNTKNTSTDPVLGMLEKTLDMAQRQMEPGIKNHQDIFFPRNDLRQKQKNIGGINNPRPFMLSEGTLIPVVLLNEINTNLPGHVLARVTQNIWDSKTGQSLLIPQNSKIIGSYRSNIGHGQVRAQVVWKRIIFPNQQSVNLGAMAALDKQGISGANGKVNNHYDKVALGLLLTTTLGAGVRMTQGKYDPNSASIGQEFGNSLAQETMRVGNKITDKMLAVPPTIRVPMGKRLNIFVEQDLNLQPYRG